MSTPFDEVIEAIRVAGYHNQRRPGHSDIVSKGIIRDLRARCPVIAEDFDSNMVRSWSNVSAPGARGRKIDLFVGEIDGKTNQKPDVRGARICVENKSLMTAHRNKTNRLDDLGELLGAIHRTKAEAIIVATVLVGTAPRVLNVPDHVKKAYKKDPRRFEAEVVPRLSSGDATLWTDFEDAISENKPDQAANTVAKFQSLPRRPPGHTHVMGFDFVMIVPVFIDNVNPPSVCRQNGFGIDIDATYERMLATICRAYEARWHL
jgi:hypothetical protein